MSEPSLIDQLCKAYAELNASRMSMQSSTFNGRERTDRLIAEIKRLEAAIKAKPQIGQKVRKRTGDYQFDGEIIAVIRKKSGAIRYAVEDDRGLVLIMNERQVMGGGET